MSMLQAIKEYMLTWTGLVEGAGVFSDHPSGNIIQYSIIQLPVQRVLEEDLVGNQECQYAFAFQSIESTMDETQRLKNAALYDELEDWFKSQSKLELFPSLDEDQRPEKLEIMTSSYLIQEATNIGVYQIQCRLLYTQTD